MKEQARFSDNEEVKGSSARPAWVPPTLESIPLRDAMAGPTIPTVSDAGTNYS